MAAGIIKTFLNARNFNEAFELRDQTGSSLYQRREKPTIALRFARSHGN
jgi:hypothetical protein